MNGVITPLGMVRWEIKPSEIDGHIRIEVEGDLSPEQADLLATHLLSATRLTRERLTREGCY